MGIENQKETSQGFKTIAIVWIILSPVFCLMGLISSIESTTSYLVQLILISIYSCLGFVSGFGLFFGKAWARKILMTLSWLGLIFFSGSGLYLLILSFPRALNDGMYFMLPVALGIIATGIPFYYMAKRFAATL